MVVAKSSIVLDVKSWGDETDMKEMENKVRSIQQDGLVWGACKFFFIPFIAPSIRTQMSVTRVRGEKW